MPDVLSPVIDRIDADLEAAIGPLHTPLPIPTIPTIPIFHYSIIPIMSEAN